MGRITIFTEDECPRSLALRSLLFDNSIPFHEISLSEHPERRPDMITLTNELSTPQVFFNSLHVGGLLHLEEIFELYRKEALAKAHHTSNDDDEDFDKNKNKNMTGINENERGDEEQEQEQEQEQESNSHQALNDGVNSKIPNPILERITSSVLNQQSPNHEVKLRLQTKTYSRNSIFSTNSRYEDLKIEYKSWNERLKENDLFYLRHGDGEENLSISNITRTLIKRSSPLSDPSLSPQDSLLHYTIYDHYLKTGKVHKKCFKGKDAVNVLKKEYKFLKTNTDAVAFGQTLLDLGILYCVYSKTKHNEKASFEGEGEPINHFSEKGIYRLQPLHSTEIKNKFRLWSKIDIVDKYDPDPLLTLSRLSKMLHQAIEQCANSTGNCPNVVDYSNIQNSELFMLFEETLCLLQLTNLDDMFDKARLAFFINLYNLMVKHAIVLQLNPCKASFYSTDIKYMIGQHAFSLDDIYHGILRRNSKHPKTGKEMLSSPPSSLNRTIDPRDKFKCLNLNPRIHFALITNYIDSEETDDTKSNKGSTNPHHHLLTTKYYHEFHQEAVNSELFIIAQRSCKEDGRIVVNTKKNILKLPKFIKLGLGDFMSHNWNGLTDHHLHELPKVMAKYFIGEKRELLESMIKESPYSITVTFHENYKSTSLVHYGCDCLPAIPWNHYAQRKRMGQSKSFGGFPQSYPEDDEIQLLDKEEYDFYGAIAQQSDDDLSHSTGKSWKGCNRTNSWDVMDDCSSWSLSLTSWGELPSKMDIQTNKDDQSWEAFQSLSFSKQSIASTATSPSSPSGKDSEGQKSEFSRRTHTPATPDGNKKNSMQPPTPDTGRTVSTTQGSPTSFVIESSPSPSLLTATTPNRRSNSSILIMPKFPDDFSNFSGVIDEEGISFATSDNATSHDNCSNPPVTRRLFKEKNNDDNEIASTKNIINLFFQDDLFKEMNDEDKRSVRSASSTATDNDLDSFSYNSKNVRQESTGSLLSRDTDFENLFNSSMASI